MALIAAGVFVGPAISPAMSQAAAKADRWSAWTGLSAGPDYIYAYDGLGVFLTGDTGSGGLMARFAVGGGAYRTSGATSHKVIQYDGSLMLGYRARFESATVAVFAGGDVSRHDNKDRDANPRGTEWGVKELVEAYLPLGSAFYVAGFGAYSTAFDTFSSDARLAYRLTETIAAGPELGAVGSAGFAQGRAGLRTSWKLLESAELSAAGGAGWDLDDADTGFYGVLNLYAEF